jgi:hypothetical protein
MYSRHPTGVNVAAAFAGLLTLAAGAVVQGQSPGNRPTLSCDPAFARLFAPPHPRLGRYEVCPSAEPLSALADAGWTIEATPPLDAFGSAGTFDRAKLARVYGGTPVRVARGWRTVDGQFEAITLLSPYPDPALTRLESGTLIIRLILCCT